MPTVWYLKIILVTLITKKENGNIIKADLLTYLKGPLIFKGQEGFINNAASSGQEQNIRTTPTTVFLTFDEPSSPSPLSFFPPNKP